MEEIKSAAEMDRLMDQFMLEFKQLAHSDYNHGQEMKSWISKDRAAPANLCADCGKKTHSKRCSVCASKLAKRTGQKIKRGADTSNW